MNNIKNIELEFKDISEKYMGCMTHHIEKFISHIEEFGLKILVYRYNYVTEYPYITVQCDSIGLKETTIKSTDIYFALDEIVELLNNNKSFKKMYHVDKAKHIRKH